VDIFPGDTVELTNPMDDRCGMTAVVKEVCVWWASCLVSGETMTNLFFPGEIKKV
jgi:hypothetical protein